MQDINVFLFLRFSIWRVLCTRDCWEIGIYPYNSGGLGWGIHHIPVVRHPHFTKEKGVNPMSVHKKCSSLLSLVPLGFLKTVAQYSIPHNIFWNFVQIISPSMRLIPVSKEIGLPPRRVNSPFFSRSSHHGWPSLPIPVILEPRSSFLISSPVTWFSLNAGKYPPAIFPGGSPALIRPSAKRPTTAWSPKGTWNKLSATFDPAIGFLLRISMIARAS